jgi:hypothetical protein
MLRTNPTLSRRLLARTTQNKVSCMRTASYLFNSSAPLGRPPVPHACSQPYPVNFRPTSAFESLRFFSSKPANPPAAEAHEFQAETRQLLDIVIHSVYTDKEVCKFFPFPSILHLS